MPRRVTSRDAGLLPQHDQGIGAVGHP
ncbi:MAG: hypothetical protein QOJ04_368, partial [Caballeronia sp.]|nr:hypothetical protein [Caballeronia sp.]